MMEALCKQCQGQGNDPMKNGQGNGAGAGYGGNGARPSMPGSRSIVGPPRSKRAGSGSAESSHSAQGGQGNRGNNHSGNDPGKSSPHHPKPEKRKSTSPTPTGNRCRPPTATPSANTSNPPISNPHRGFGRNRQQTMKTVICLLTLLLACLCPASAKEGIVQCGNLIYAGNKTSRCFSDEFLSTVQQKTSISTSRRFRAVRLDSEELFQFPFVVMTGEGNFTSHPRNGKTSRNTSPGALPARLRRMLQRNMGQILPQGNDPDLR